MSGSQYLVCIAVLLALLMGITAFASFPGDGARAATPLELDGSVLTGDGASFVRGAGVTLLVYNGPRVAQNLTYFHVTQTDDAGHFNFTVPAPNWDGGFNVTLRADYPLVGASSGANFSLSASAMQQRDILLPWNRTLGAEVKVADTLLSSPRDGRATFKVNTTNGGNDTDALLLWAEVSNGDLVTAFYPGNRTEMGPGAAEVVDLVVQGPDAEPGDHLVTLRWRSEWFPGEGGSIDLTWRLLPEVDLSLNASGVSWWPDPMFDGDNSLLNCTVHNSGRDAAAMTNVSVELYHSVQGRIFRDLVRVDVPGGGNAVASFPWPAVYSGTPYRLVFMVEHDLDPSPGDNIVEVALPVGVHNEAPQVSFIHPANGTGVNGTVQVRLSVMDPDTPITGVFLAVDNGSWIDLPTTGPYTHGWDTTTASEGWHVLAAYATDQYASSPIVSIDVKVENLGPNHPPEVYIVAPLEGDVVGEELRASGIVFDRDDHVELVQFRLDGGDWYAAEGSSTWSFSIDTGGLDEGDHAIEVRAWDGIDHSEVMTRNVSVTRQEPSALLLELKVFPVQVYPSEDIYVRGEVRYDNGVRAHDLTVWVRGPADLTAKEVIDELGRFEVLAQAPGSEGQYEYQANCTDPGGLEAANTTTLVVILSIEPDLTVTSVTLPSGIIAIGRNLTIAVEVENLGASAANATLKAWEGEAGVGEPIVSRAITVYSGDVGLTISFNWTPLIPGRTSLVVEVVDVDPADVNMSNNRRTVTVDVKNVPDLWVVSVVVSNFEPYEDTLITVSVRLQNIGGLNASCDVKLYLDGWNDTDFIDVDPEVVVLAGGLAYSNFEWRTTKGAHRFYAVVTNVHPKEWNTDNNRASTTVNVQGPFEPSEDGDGGFIPGFGSSGALLAALATSVIIALRRARTRRRG